MTVRKLTNPKDAVGIRKVAFSCVPWGVVVGIAVAMMEGALKYGRHNYRHPLGGEETGEADGAVRASVYFDANLRHIISWWEGEDIDPDSGLSHVDKAAASIAVLRDGMVNGLLVDDRPPRSHVPALIREMAAKVGELLDRYGPGKPAWITRR